MNEPTRNLPANVAAVWASGARHDDAIVGKQLPTRVKQ